MPGAIRNHLPEITCPKSLAEVCFTAKLRARKQLGRGVALFDLAKTRACRPVRFCDFRRRFE
jgi:hypothetical protein